MMSESNAKNNLKLPKAIRLQVTEKALYLSTQTQKDYVTILALKMCHNRLWKPFYLIQKNIMEKVN